MDEKMIYVPYGDFVDGINAMGDLANIRAMITNGKEYCSSAIMAVLGLPVKKEGPFNEEHTKGEK